MMKNTAVLLALAIVATEAEQAQAQARTASRSAPSCSQVPALQDEFRLLNDQINIDRQIVANFGFDKSVEDFERAATLPAAQVAEGMSGIRKLLFDEALKSARAQLAQSIVSGAADVAMTGAGEAARTATAGMDPDVIRAIRRVSPPRNAQHEAVLSRLETAAEVTDALAAIDHAKSGWALATPVVQGQMLEAAVELAQMVGVKYAERLAERGVGTVLAGSSRAGWAGVLVSLNQWAWMQAYRSAEAVYMVHRLTQATEGDLHVLRATSDRLKTRVLRLRDVKADLSDLAGRCDRTRVVKKRNRTREAIVWLGIAGAAGAAAGLSGLGKEEPGDGTGGGSSGACISTRSCIVNQVGGGCSCSGSRSGPCNYSGTPGGVGASCAGGVPCASGLTCTNGRCEGSGGRCP